MILNHFPIMMNYKYNIIILFQLLWLQRKGKKLLQILWKRHRRPRERSQERGREIAGTRLSNLQIFKDILTMYQKVLTQNNKLERIRTWNILGKHRHTSINSL